MAAKQMTEEEFDALVDEKVGEKMQSKLDDMVESGEAPTWMRGMTTLGKSLMAQSRAMTHAIEQSAGLSIDKADHTLRNADLPEKRSLLAGAKAFANGGGSVGGRQVSPQSPGAVKGMGAWSIKGSGDITAKGLTYALLSLRNVGKFDWEHVQKLAESEGDEQFSEFAKAHMERDQKDVSVSDHSQGSSLIPTDMAEDYIPFLHGNTVLRQLGPETMTLQRGLEIGSQTGTVTAVWETGGNTVNASTPTTGTIRLDPKKLMIFVIFENEFLQQAPQAARDMIRADLPRAAQATEETAFLRSPGTSGEPAGLRFLASSGNRDVDRTQASSTNGSSVTEINGDLLNLQQNVYGGSSNPSTRVRPAYVMQHRTVMGLRGLTNGDEDLSHFVPMLNEGVIHGAQVGITNQLPTNLDVDSSGDTDHTELYFAEMADVIIGDSVTLQVDETTEATVLDASGNDRRTFASDSTALRLKHLTDIALKRNTAASNLKNVDWGADHL